MVPVPEGAPEALGPAFAHIGAVTAPTIMDMKVMVLVEAAGKTLYEKSAEAAEHPEVRRLLLENGEEEMKHARRVAQAIKLISGEAFDPPAAADNPYLTGHIPVVALTQEGLKATAQNEFGGTALYERWAASLDHAEAAELFRLNGKEESDHGNRLLQAATFLDA